MMRTGQAGHEQAAVFVACAVKATRILPPHATSGGDGGMALLSRTRILPTLPSARRRGVLGKRGGGDEDVVAYLQGGTTRVHDVCRLDKAAPDFGTDNQCLCPWAAH
jgi:hypothetical protein